MLYNFMKNIAYNYFPAIIPYWYVIKHRDLLSGPPSFVRNRFVYVITRYVITGKISIVLCIPKTGRHDFGTLQCKFVITMDVITRVACILRG